MEGPTEERSKAKLGVAVIGHGRIGRVHARNVARHPLLRLVLIAGRHETESAKVLAHELGARFVAVGEGQGIGADGGWEGVQAVVVASPTPSHKDIILQCVGRRLPVFVEKPVAFSPRDIEECYEAAKKSGSVLFCGAFQLSAKWLSSAQLTRT
jgi:myo-inositol 2-dehydrogenase/D-chiro-inositol 1-dehydrogenase